MKKWMLTLWLFPAFGYAQLGSKMKTVTEFIGADQIIKTEFKSGYLIQDIKTGTKEITTIYYNQDSVAVMVSITRKDSFFYFRDMVNFQKANIPQYRAQKKCMEGTTTFHWDTIHQILLLINYNVNPTEPGIIGFAATKDPALIKAWTGGNKDWIKE